MSQFNLVKFAIHLFALLIGSICKYPSRTKKNWKKTHVHLCRTPKSVAQRNETFWAIFQTLRIYDNDTPLALIQF